MDKKIYWVLISLLAVSSIDLVLSLIELFKRVM